MNDDNNYGHLYSIPNYYDKLIARHVCIFFILATAASLIDPSLDTQMENEMPSCSLISADTIATQGNTCIIVRKYYIPVIGNVKILGSSVS